MRITALFTEQQRELISRLMQPLSEPVDPMAFSRMRRIRLSLMVNRCDCINLLDCVSCNDTAAKPCCP